MKQHSCSSLAHGRAQGSSAGCRQLWGARGSQEQGSSAGGGCQGPAGGSSSSRGGSVPAIGDQQGRGEQAEGQQVPPEQVQEPSVVGLVHPAGRTALSTQGTAAPRRHRRRPGTALVSQWWDRQR